MIRLKSLLTENPNIRQLNRKDDSNPFWIIDQNRDAIASQFGETITGILAAGSNGFVYELASGKLLKITPDAAEVAAVIKKRRLGKMRHLISYYDVRNIDNLMRNFSSNETPQYSKDTNFYAIIMDRVTTLNDREKREWTEGYEIFLNVYGDEDENQPIEEFITEVYGDPLGISMVVRDFWRRIYPQRKNIIRDFKRAGVNFIEAHQNNVGFDQFGQLVHFDPWIKGSGWASQPIINKSKLNKPVSIPTKYTTDGIDTPNDPNM
jgi:hypothetical protein